MQSRTHSVFFHKKKTENTHPGFLENVKRFSVPLPLSFSLTLSLQYVSPLFLWVGPVDWQEFCPWHGLQSRTEKPPPIPIYLMAGKYGGFEMYRLMLNTSCFEHAFTIIIYCFFWFRSRTILFFIYLFIYVFIFYSSRAEGSRLVIWYVNHVSL